MLTDILPPKLADLVRQGLIFAPKPDGTNADVPATTAMDFAARVLDLTSTEKLELKTAIRVGLMEFEAEALAAIARCKHITDEATMRTAVDQYYPEELAHQITSVTLILSIADAKRFTAPAIIDSANSLFSTLGIRPGSED